MLGVFSGPCGDAPPELNVWEDANSAGIKPVANNSIKAIELFKSAKSAKGTPVILQVGKQAFAYLPEYAEFTGEGGIFALFTGRLQNVGDLRELYGFRRSDNISDGMLVLEMFRSLRDRAPYSTDHCLRLLKGEFAFFLYDSSIDCLFIARDSKGRSKLFWGVGPDGAMLVSGDQSSLDDICRTSCAAFPPGCFFTSAGGLHSFDNPNKVLRAVHSVDPAGCRVAAEFEIDPGVEGEAIAHRIGSNTNLTYIKPIKKGQMLGGSPQGSPRAKATRDGW
eukprot:jgi/Mesvir1/15165/Mv04846-RA.1